jgi:tetratricopeptide (TPR) repeat protein
LKAITLYYLAQVNEDLGRIDEAVRFCGQAVSILQKASAPDDPRVQTMQIELARLYAAFGQLDTAEKLLKRVILQSSSQIDDGLHQASALTAMAAVDVHRKRFKDAERLDRQAISILERRTKPHQPDLFTATALLAIILDATGRPREALSYTEQAAEILQHLETVEPIDTIEIRAQVAELYAKTGRGTDAESYSRQALTDVERIYGANHVYTAWILLARSDVLRRLGHRREAQTAKQRGQLILAQSGQMKRLAVTVPFRTLIPIH